MDVDLSPETRARLEDLASRVSVPQQMLAKTAIDRYLDYEDWLRYVKAKTEEGFAHAERGELLGDEQLWRDLARQTTEFLESRR